MRVKAQFAVLDGEIVYLDEHGKPQFYELMRRKADRCVFYAFDLLSLNGEDLRSFPLLDRKRRLKKLIPRSSRCRLRYLDHVEGQGIRLFESACALDLEGVVAKFKAAPTPPTSATRPGSKSRTSPIPRPRAGTTSSTSSGKALRHPNPLERKPVADIFFLKLAGDFARTSPTANDRGAPKK